MGFLTSFIDNAAGQTPKLFEDLAEGMPDDPNDFAADASPVHKFKFPTKNGDCPECGKKLKLRTSRFGKFYGCSGFPECTYKCTERQYNAAVTEPEETNQEEKQEFCADKLNLQTCPTVEYNGGTYSDPFGVRCKDCALFSHLENKCVYRDWNDVGKDRPGCDMYVSSDLDERLAMLEFMKTRRNKQRNVK